MDRYSRQIRFHGIGVEGQKVLSEARVAVVGLGGLGSHVAEILCRMGVGTLRLIDRDYVDVQDLHRQSLYTEEDAQQVLPKVIALREHLKSVNSAVSLETRLRHVDARNVRRLLKGVDVVVDGSDNLGLRLLLNEACVHSGKAFVFGAVAGASGMAMGIAPERTACLRCLLPDEEGVAPLSPSESGLYPPAVRALSSLQAHLVVRALLSPKNPDEWAGRLYTLDLWSGDFDVVSVRRRKKERACPVCVRHEYDYLQPAKATGPQVVVDENVVTILPEKKSEVDLEVLRARLYRVDQVKRNDYLLWAHIGDLDMAVFKDGRMLVKGASDWSEAVRLYERYLGE